MSININDAFLRDFFNLPGAQVQAQAPRLEKLRELAATIECLRASRVTCDGRAGLYGLDVDRMEKKARTLLDELFPEEPIP